MRSLGESLVPDDAPEPPRSLTQPETEAPREAAGTPPVAPDDASRTVDAGSTPEAAAMNGTTAPEEVSDRSAAAPEPVNESGDGGSAVEDVSEDSTPDTQDAPDTGEDIPVAGHDDLVPHIATTYFDLPDAEPDVESLEERLARRSMADRECGSVSRIHDEEAFLREAEAHLALKQGEQPDTYPSWIRKPEAWPTFMEFPNKRDMQAIRVAEQQGRLDDEARARFNEHFEELSQQMQRRAKQLNEWMLTVNKDIMDQERRTGLTRRLPFIKRTIIDLEKDREKAGRKDGTPQEKDPFCDIKWAVLLDPYASPDDPRFANVARWSHRGLETLDGGKLYADDNGMFTPSGSESTEMAGAMAVQEAVERGWSSIDIAGTEAFVKGAREAAVKAGLGAKITTQYGYLGRDRTEFIMPKPPQLEGVENDADKLSGAHDELTSGQGRAPEGEAGPADESDSGARGNLAVPGLAQATGQEAEFPFDPFDDDEDQVSADARAAAQMREEDDAPEARPL